MTKAQRGIYDTVLNSRPRILFVIKSLIFCLLLVLYSCSKIGPRNRYPAGLCLKEYNKKIKSEEYGVSIYKINKSHEEFYEVSTYNNFGWIHLGRKPASYFSENKKFRFKATDCPDGSGISAEMAEKINSIRRD